VSHNAGWFWSRRGLMKRAGTIHVVIGKPIDPAGKDARVVTDEVRAAIEAGLARISATAQGPETGAVAQLTP